MTRPDNPIAVALDTADLHRLEQLAADLGPRVGVLKVGLQAFSAHGPAALRAAAAHGPVFADVKLHDIPNTVTGAAAALAGHGVDYFTVHASGGPAMVAAAVKAAPQVCVLAVTVLTSMDDKTLAAVGQDDVTAQVARLATLAVEAGAGGIVCAPHEATAVRKAVGPAPVIVTPGVRPASVAAGDQARVATPVAARAAGADILVIGRPITGADDPSAALDAIRTELNDASTNNQGPTL